MCPLEPLSCSTVHPKLFVPECSVCRYDNQFVHRLYQNKNILSNGVHLDFFIVFRFVLGIFVFIVVYWEEKPAEPQICDFS